MKPNPYSRNNKPLNSDMNVVPYIDVMLVLLVIFMVTAPMLTTGVDVDLPKHEATNLATSKQLPVIISITKDGKLFLDYESNETEVEVEEDELISTLSDIQSKHKSEQGQDLQVMVNADQNNQYGDVVGLMASLQRAGIRKVGLLTDSPEKKE